MRKQKTKRTMMGISLLAVMGITLLTPGTEMNKVKATSTPSDAGIDADATSISSDMEIVTAPAASPVAIDSTNFPDNAFREWVKLNCDKNSDGQLSADEISQCTIINVAGKGIANLQGIEYFSNLRELNCCKNNLSSLDVSSNTALEKLDCSVNNLSSLDVSNNTALKELHCGTNNLSSLDVTNNTVLEVLYCDNNNMSSLELSNNTALKHLSCYDNNLSSLDMSNNTALTFLDCDNNNLSSLDMSNNTALKDLNCDCNNLSSLDVTNNTALTKLSCYSNNLRSLDVNNNTALMELTCSDNDLSNLDVTNNTALMELSCSYNNLSSLDVNNNTALEDLSCFENNISSLDLGKNTNLSYFVGDQIVSVPMYKNKDEYYIDLSKLPLDLKRVSIDEASGETDGTTYNSTSGRIYLSDTKNVGDTVQYLYETNAPALYNTKMTVTLKISEVKDITEPTTEEPTTEQPTTEQPTTEQPAVIVPPTTQEANGKDPSPKTGDTMPLYPVISLLLVSFAGIVTLYIRRRKKI